MTAADETELQGVHPDLIARLGKVLDAMAVLGYPMMVTDGVRTTAHQEALYAQGRTAPGPIVTNADGVTHLSNHQVRPGETYGRAADCCFIVDGRPSWDARLPWKAYGATLEAVGLHWGGDWLNLHDLPHAELP